MYIRDIRNLSTPCITQWNEAPYVLVVSVIIPLLDVNILVGVSR